VTYPYPVGAGAPPVCPRHPDRISYVSCQRCGRPTCPECQRPAAVGIQCVDCVAEARRTAPRTGTRYGGAGRPGGRPVVTLGIIALCVAVYAGQLVSDRVTVELAFYPVLAWEEPWRFLTAAFAHSPGFLLHILFNMYALWITGSYLEPLLGRARFLALYLVSAVGGSVGVLLLAAGQAWVTPVVGASGAVFGLFAALFVLNRHLGRQTGGILAVLVINMVLGFVVQGIAWQAHLGGAATGALVALALVATSVRGRTRAAALRRRWQWPAVGLVLVALVVLAYLRLASVGLAAPVEPGVVHTLSTGLGITTAV